jgi:F-type H+-transporting ATPase subunit gamma
MTDRPAEIQKRLNGIDEIGQVVGALRAMAAGQVSAARGAAEAVNAYAGTIEQALSSVTATGDIPASREGAGLLLVVGAAQGFSGSYSARIVEAVHKDLCNTPAKPGLLVLGQRTLEMLEAGGMPILWSADLPAHPAAIPELASRVTDTLMRLSPDHPGPVRAVAGASEAGQAMRARTLFPPPPVLPPAGSNSTSLTTLPAAELVAGLLDEALFAALVHVLVDGMAGEAQARVEAMARAQTNLRARRTDVERQYQQARQEQMTTEMIELVVSRL